jgi:hypothetical protein
VGLGSRENVVERCERDASQLLTWGMGGAIAVAKVEKVQSRSSSAKIVWDQRFEASTMVVLCMGSIELCCVEGRKDIQKERLLTGSVASAGAKALAMVRS